MYFPLNNYKILLLRQDHGIKVRCGNIKEQKRGKGRYVIMRPYDLGVRYTKAKWKGADV